ncbi:expressed unknown protein [Seminavis robusta]|uniref:Origin recognition complex subunit 4 n=1 Tax=Seminavis robusta TaxID=568900 RepID=A0A9N8EHP0_9STRA|nr:expressed unknown protein [Seminavis robusta]|eukprot:Sro1011_g230960.1 n/a (660) ;mRNA; f:74-2053
MIDHLQQVIHCFSDNNNKISSANDNLMSPREAQSFWTTTTSSSSSGGTDNNMKDIVHRYAPVGLESQFEQLYSLLHPCLVVHENETNAAAFLLGQRGMGKGLLVERCLQALQDELTFAPSSTNKKSNKMQHFRVVKVHGVLIPGNDVSLVVKDMLQQLSQMVLQQRREEDQQMKKDNTTTTTAACTTPLPTKHKNHATTTATDSCTSTSFGDEQSPNKRFKTGNGTPTAAEQMLRLRMSTFESNLQLLSQTLKLARVDQIPILIILDQVDAFLGGDQNTTTSRSSNNNSNHHHNLQQRDRQLLLYHLLDRVATQGSNVCLIGMTQQLAWRSQLEKRIKSRMEGTSKEIFVGACPSFSAVTNVLLSHFNVATQQQPCLHEQVARILTPPQKNNAAAGVELTVWQTLEREYRMGKNIRWFSRIFTMALALYRGDWIEYKCRLRKLQDSQPEPPTFHASYLLDALVSQGASIPNVPKQSNNNNNNNNKRSSNIVIMTGGGGSQQLQAKTAVDPRIQALLDLSMPQVALILSARRILARDAQWNNEGRGGAEGIMPAPLTLGRMVQEYERFIMNQQSGGCTFSRHLLWISFQELLHLNLLRPAMDHCGTGPFQYDHQQQHYSSLNEAEDVPLHLLVDANRELMDALQELDCTTAMREWGRKTN